MPNYRGTVVVAILLICACANGICRYQEYSKGKQTHDPIDAAIQGLDDVTYSAAGWPWAFYEHIDRSASLAWHQWNLLSLSCNIAVWGLIFAIAWWHSGARLRNSNEAKTTGRWRCSLADLFVAMLLFASAFGYFTRNRGLYADSQKLISAIRSNRGIPSEAFYWPSFLPNDLLLDYVLPRERIVCVSIDDPPDSLLKEIVAQPNLQSLCLSGASYTLAELRPLVQNPHLQYLRLSGRALDSETLQLIGQMESLQALSLANTNFTNAQLSHLGKMPHLRYLDLDHTEIDLQDSVARPWMQTVRYLRLPRPSGGKALAIKLDGWAELLGVRCMEKDKQLQPQEILGLSISNCPKLQKLSIPEPLRFDLKLVGLPKFREIDLRDAQGTLYKHTSKIPRVRTVHFKDLPSYSLAKFDVWGFDRIRVENCPQLQCEAYWTPEPIVNGTNTPNIGRGLSEPTRQMSTPEARKLIEGVSKSMGITALTLAWFPNKELDLSPIAACSTIKKLNLPLDVPSKSQLQQLSSLHGLEEIEVISYDDFPYLLEIWPNLRRIGMNLPERTPGGITLAGGYGFGRPSPKTIHLKSAKKLESFLKGQWGEAASVHLTDLPQLNDLLHLSRSIESIQIKGAPRLKGLITFAPWPEDASIAGMEKLEIFAAGGPQFDDNDFAGIEYSTTLRSLTLGHCVMTPEKLSAIGKFRNLIGLGLSGSQVTDETVRNWADLKGLQTLLLDRTQVSSESVAWICKLRSLMYLSIDSQCFASITPEQLDLLNSLSSLSFYGDGLAMEKLARMANWKKLQMLRIENASLTREMLSRLLDCLPKMVSVLDLCNCKIAQDDLEKFIDCLPQSVALGVEGLNVLDEQQIDLLRDFRAAIEDNADFLQPRGNNYSIRSSTWPVTNKTTGIRSTIIFSNGMYNISTTIPLDPSVIVKPSLFAPRPRFAMDATK